MGTQVWVWQDGTDDSGDILRAAASGIDGAVFVAGYTYADWAGASSGGEDFIVAKLDGREPPHQDSTDREIWKYQNGTWSDDRVNAAEFGRDGSVVLAGHAGESFSVFKLDDDDGSVLFDWKGDASVRGVEDVALGLSVLDDGSVVVVGYTRGEWNATLKGRRDFAAFRLGSDGEVLWKFQDGTPENDVFHDAAVVEFDGSVVLAGFSDGNFSGLNSFSFADNNLSDDDNSDLNPQPVAVKLGLDDGHELWRWSLEGLSGQLKSAATVDGGVVLAGWTDRTEIFGEQESYDFFAVKLDLEGNLVWRWKGGTAGVDELRAVTALADGTIVLAGNTAGDWDGFTAGPDDFAAATLNASTGELLFKWQRGSAGDDDMEAIALGPDGTIILAGYADASWDEDGDNLGHNDFVAVALDPATFTPAATTTAAPPAPGSAPSKGDVVAVLTSEPFLAGISSAAAAGLVAGGVWLRRRRKHPRVSPGSTKTDPDTPVEGRKHGHGAGLGSFTALGQAASVMAHSCHVPGVSETAALMETVVGLVSDGRDGIRECDSRLRQCRAIIVMLGRVEDLRQRCQRVEDAEGVLISGVEDAVDRLVGIIQTYQSKKKLAQVLTSTLLKRRLEEADKAIDSAMVRLIVIHKIPGQSPPTTFGKEPSSTREDGDKMEEVENVSKPEDASLSARRRRRLEKIEIPEGDVSISDEVLGKGGFGWVYLADYGGRNAAAKVLDIDHGLDDRDGADADDEYASRQIGEQAMESQRRQRRDFLREMQSMLRLSSPHCVQVYGMMTSSPYHLVIVMELLVGGDLRMFLKRRARERLPEGRCRQIIGDVCAGMNFLHGRETVHGDLKSANVLLDGAGRAKIGDFGTSRWTQHTNSTSLAMYSSKNGQSIHISLAWSAPEVLNGERSSYASDVYSFGVVVWEVITTELPWASAECARDVMCAVINGTRPLFPADTPAGIAAIAKECWAEAPYDRPSFKRVMAGLRLRSKGLSEQGRELENKCCGDSSSGIDTLGQRTEERPASPGVGNFLSRASYQ